MVILKCYFTHLQVEDVLIKTSSFLPCISFCIFYVCLVNCKKDNFSSKKDAPPVAPASGGIDTTNTQNCTNGELNCSSIGQIGVTQTLNPDGSVNGSVQIQKNLVDFLFLVDTSSSMDDEMSQVSKNLAKFIAETKKNADIKLGVVGEDDFKDRIKKIDKSVINSISYFERNINSTNALYVLHSGIRDASNKCPQYEDTTKVTETSKYLSSFFRKDSVKHVVVITDDNAKGVNETNFEECTKSSEISIDKLSGFIGLSGEFKLGKTPGTVSMGCKIDRKGVAYERVATLNRGRMYDICQKDWAQSFEDLANASTRLSFKLPAVQNIEGYKIQKLSGATENGSTVEIGLDKATLLKAPSGVFLEFSELDSSIRSIQYVLSKK
jgi:hypothetical protein